MSQDLQERIMRAAAVLKEAGARKVYVFGSARGGKRREGSDIDLAVSGLPPGNFFRAMGQAHQLLGCPLDLIDLDEDTPFTRYLREEKELLLVE